MPCDKHAPVPFWMHPVFAALLSAGGAIGSSWILKHVQLTAGGRLAVALLALPPSIYLMYCMFRWVQGMDELQQRIQAEALALAFTGSMLLILGLEYVQKAGFARELSWDFAWGAMTGLYMGAYFVVSRRYA